MAGHYNPVVRTFARLRAEMVRATGLPRHRIRPHVALEELIPRSGRRVAWRRLRRDGLTLPPLELSRPVRRFTRAVVLFGVTAVALGLQTWVGLQAVAPLGLLAALATRPWAVEFALGMRTAGELSLYLTRFGEHRESGYRWTSNEVTTKVRMVIAESLGLPLDRVRPECTWAELGAD
jgi:hypothetical protein